MSNLALCPRCKGAGKITLPSHYARLVEALTPGPLTSRALASMPLFSGLSQHAIIMRLNTLRRLDVIDRIKSSHPTGGIEYVWEVKS